MFSTVAQITENLFLSSFHPVRPEKIRSLGIQLVVNCTMEIPSLRLPEVETMQLHVDDTPYSNLRVYFDRVADRINDVIAKGGKALVHCVAGVSRSSTIVIAYLMKARRMSLREAYYLVKSKRPFIRPNTGFWKQLIEYEHKLFGLNTVRMVYSVIHVHVYSTFKYILFNNSFLAPFQQYLYFLFSAEFTYSSTCIHVDHGKNSHVRYMYTILYMFHVHLRKFRCRCTRTTGTTYK